MSRVWITDSAVLTGLGNDLEALWQGLMAGESAVRPFDRFDVGRYNTRVASLVEGLDSAGGQSRMFPLLERLMHGFAPVPDDCCLITATTKGCIDVIEQVHHGSGGDFSDIPASALLSWLSRRLGLARPAANINAACASSTIAVARAAALIDSGRTDAVLVVCMDLVSEFVFSGFSALQALSPERSRPFDRNRSGLSLGEGGAALLLMSAERARKEQRTCLGSIVGWGAANDATHVTAPARDGCGLIQATRQAFAKAAVTADEIAAISAHGTGTVYNDQMELTAFQSLFGSRSIPMNSVKGAIGHTLGAAGGIEVALGLHALKLGTLPPTAGLQEAESGAELLVSSRPQTIHGSYLLSTNSGFGGVNAALILAGGEI